MFRRPVLWEFFLILIHIISLAHFLRRWEIVGANPLIELGYRIPFIYVPTEVELETYLSKTIKNIANNSTGRNHLSKLA